MSDEFGQLVHATAKRGKSHYAATSYYDFEKKTAIRNGRHIVVGLENVDHLGLPEKNLIILKPNIARPAELYDTAMRLFKDLHKACKQGSGPEVIVLDSVSEFDLQVQRKYRGESDDDTVDIKSYGNLLATFFDTLQYIHPKETGVPLIVTARVNERRKAVRNNRGEIWIPEDKHPEIADFDYYPAVTGKFGHIIPHYFQMVNYMENVEGPVTVGKNGKKVTKTLHRMYFQSDGTYYIANAYSSMWEERSLQPYYDNITFDQVLNLIKRKEDSNQKDSSETANKENTGKEVSK